MDLSLLNRPRKALTFSLMLAILHDDSCSQVVPGISFAVL